MKIPVMLKKMRLSTIEDLFTWVGALSILTIVAMSTSNVFGRYLFNSPVPGTVEVARMVLMIIMIFSVSSAQRFDLHISMDMLPEVLKRKTPNFYHGLMVFHLIIFLVIMGIIAYFFIPAAMESKAIFEKTDGPLFLPFWPFLLGVTAGCSLLCIRLVVQIYGHIRRQGNLEAGQE
ncbi:TRAP transporter small permease [Chloroflexota bacterium]